MINLISSLLITALVLPALCCTLGSENGCETSVANGLTSQLVAELNLMGVSFETLSDTNRFRCSSPCYLQRSARDALAAATISKDDYITINSAYRSSAQQYLLYRWNASGLCPLPKVTTPGKSKHEGGLAIDINEKLLSYWKTALESQSWAWFGPNDTVHFTYTGSGAMPGVPKQNLLAFQRLWNTNNPSDLISEDGGYGTETATRFDRSPCSGW